MIYIVLGHTVQRKRNTPEMKLGYAMSIIVALPLLFYNYPFFFCVLDFFSLHQFIFPIEKPVDCRGGLRLEILQ